MFEKRRKIGEIHKKETDWGAVFGVLFWGFIILAVLSSCSG